jgi:hypothetical protein
LHSLADAQTAITWNYTTILNIIFLLLAAALLIRFFRTGTGPMLKMTGGTPAQPEHPTQPEPERTTPGHAQPVTPTAGSQQPTAVMGQIRSASPPSPPGRRHSHPSR